MSPPVALIESHDGAAGGCLAAAGFAHEADRLAGIHRQADAIDCPHPAHRPFEDARLDGEMHLQPVDHQQRLPRDLGLSYFTTRLCREHERAGFLGIMTRRRLRLADTPQGRILDMAENPVVTDRTSGMKRAAAREFARVWRLTGDGIKPFVAGIDARNALQQRRGVGMAGICKISSTGPVSTMRPPYMTATRCATSATTPRSCVMRITAAPVSAWRLRAPTRLAPAQ